MIIRRFSAIIYNHAGRDSYNLIVVVIVVDDDIDDRNNTFTEE